MMAGEARPFPALWDYEFSTWPREGMFPPAVYELFKYMPRVSLTLTEHGWSVFRDALDRVHFTLREVTRTPYAAPESVDQ